MQSAGKMYRHFDKRSTVMELVEEIKARHGRPYEEIIEEATAQIRSFFIDSFARSLDPSRFLERSSIQLKLVRPRLIVALSGGLDSTVVTYLAARAIGVDNVLPVTMPDHPEDQSEHMAALTRNALGMNETGAPYVIPISKVSLSYRQAMDGFDPQLGLSTSYYTQSREQCLRNGNFASRIRIAVLYDLQRAIRGRILGTMNRPEYCQGYGAKFGSPDSYDYGVLNDFYKIDVREVGIRLGIPQAVLDAEPSTGFFAGQTHEGELGATIEEQDALVYLLFEKRLTPEQIVREYGANESFVRVMHERFVISEHKRILNAQPQVRISRVELAY